MSTRLSRRARVLAFVAAASALELAILGGCIDGTTPDCADAAAGCSPDLTDARSEVSNPNDSSDLEEASTDAPGDVSSEAVSDVSSDAPKDARGDVQDADARAGDAKDG